MAEVPAQYAEAGKYRLEKFKINQGHWEWFVKRIIDESPMYSGQSRDLSGARQSAAKSIGSYPEKVNWISCG